MNAGRGIVVMDVQASKEEIFKLLQSFHLYDRFIPTVRGVNVYHSSASKTAVRNECPV